MISRLAAIASAVVAGTIATSTHAAPKIADADTRAWWAITGELSSDAYEGRDTGSPGYARAAHAVAARFKAAGLRPAGDNGGWFQTLPLHEVRVESAGTSFTIVRATGRSPLKFLHQISVRASDDLPATLNGRLSFRGYCSKAELGSDMKGRVAVCFGARRQGVASATERLAAAEAAGAIGLIAVDDPGFTIEPARWPDAYARSVTLREDEAEAKTGTAAPAVMRISPEAFKLLLQGSGHDPDAILAEGAASRPLPAFDIAASLEARFNLTRRDYGSDNVLGLLPGTDPKLKAEVVVVSAHLDGYGHGEPVDGDDLYNGAFDDAAYVATLIRLAEQRHGKGLRRSLLFAAFTGEEKSLLGSRWFVAHPTVPKAALVADINLDQVRPLFPLKALTVHARDDTTLGDAVRAVAGSMSIETRLDQEPDRHLNQRADHWPFLSAGVPATGFVFAFDPGTDAEARYREWYRVRYHRPQDDMSQPIDFQAAADFNNFFYRVTERVADADQRPVFLPDHLPTDH